MAGVRRPFAVYGDFSFSCQLPVVNFLGAAGTDFANARSALRLPQRGQSESVFEMMCACGHSLRKMLAAVFAVSLAALPQPAAALDRVTYLLPAPIYLPAFGPWIVARQHGYYAAEGLEINFETARGGADVAKQIGVGNAVIGARWVTLPSSFAATVCRCAPWRCSVGKA